MSFNGEAVDERNFAAGGMAGVCQVAGFEDHSFQQYDLDYSAAHAIDLPPITDADSVFSHEHEPTEEGDDEVLHGHGQPGASQAEHGSGLTGHAENDKKNDKRAQRLHGKLDYCSQRANALVLGGDSGKQPVYNSIGQINQQQHYQNPGQRLDHVVQSRALAGCDQSNPTAVNVA